MVRRCVLLSSLLLLGAPVASTEQSAVTRYRVEQVVRLETTSAPEAPPPGQLWPPPVTTAVEGRFRYVLEQRPADSPGAESWRLTDVETDGPRTEPAEARDAGVERVFQLGLNWIRNLEGREFRGGPEELPAFPLGEAAPPWLTTWLHWAQTGRFADRERNPVTLPEASYQVEWLRSETRQTLCHVQRVRWAQPVAEAPESLPASLAAAGVEAHTLFAAQSLEWVAQDQPVLVYAERSGVRETYWELEKVSQADLRHLVFRLRLSVELRLERLL